MAGSTVNTQNINQSIFSVANRIGDEFAWLKRVSVEWHTALGTVQATMAANLYTYGFTSSADQNAIIQVISDVDVLISVVEGTSSSPYVARNMVPDLAAVQGVS